MSNCIIAKSSSGSLYPVGSVYFSVDNINPSVYFGGTWELIGTKLAVRENVFGNGKALGLTNGTDFYHIGSTGSHGIVPLNGIGDNVGTRTGNEYTDGKNLGVPTKAKLSTNPQNTGLIVDTVTIYSWKRTA